MTIPDGKCVEKINFTGYDNYKVTDSYIKSLNSESFTSTQYVFPAKLETGETQHASHTITLSSPATGSLSFSVAGNQTCLILTLFCSDTPRSISLPANYTYSTFSATVPLDFTGNTDVEAYTAKADGTTVKLTKVGKVAANTGLLLKKLGDATTATVPLAEGAAMAPDNDLVAVTTPISAVSLIAAGNAYVLTSDTQFSKVVSGATGEIPAGKAYLAYNNDKQAAPVMHLSFGEATAVNGIEVKPTHTNNVIYYLQGMRVNKPAAKGLYIVNGKARLYR